MVVVKSYRDLPVTLNCDQVAKTLGVSRKVAYRLTRQKGFPSIRVGQKRICVPRDRFIEWINRCADEPLE